MDTIFGFPKVDRDKEQLFKRNILQSATFLLGFTLSETVQEYKESLDSLLSEKYPNSKDLIEGSLSRDDNSGVVESEYKERKIGINYSDDEGVGISIRQDQIIITIQGKSYKNFESFKTNFKEILDSIIQILGIKKLNRVSIRKINVANLNKTEGVAPIEILSKGLAIPLLSSFFVLPNRELVNNCLADINLSNENNHMRLAYGMLGQAETNFNILLDFDVMDLGEATEAEKYFEVFEQLNDEIFNAFNWAIGNELKVFLQQ